MTQALRSFAEMMSVAWRSGRGRIAVSVVLMVLGGAAWPLLAYALREGINRAVAGDVRGGTVVGGLIGLFAICALILQHFAYVPYAEAAELAVIRMDSELIELASGSARLDHQERAGYADEISLLRKEIAQFSDGLVGLMALLSLVVSLGITAVLLVSLNPWLLLLPAAAVPPLFATQRAQRILNEARERSATATRQAQHLFELGTSAAPAKEIRVFRLQDEFRRRHRRLWADIGRALHRGELRSTAVEAIGQMTFSAAYIGAVLLVLRQTVTGQSRIGDVVLVIALATQVNQQVNSMLDLFRRLQRMAHGMARLQWLRDLTARQQPPPADAELPDAIHEGVRLRNVEFTYAGAGKPSLTGVDLTLPAGSTVAIVGENGAGKTTLCKLLCRFYDSTTGTIELDGVDIRRFPVDRWRSRIATGFQDFVRFELLARQSVGVGELPLIDDEVAVLAAVDRARATDVVSRLEQGLATQLGKSWAEGAELSGGQWQKLALGRAMMRETPLILILDEPTAALDAEAEHLLFEQYAAQARRAAQVNGAITVLVSHRFSTVGMADLILVVADGRIAEVGDHASLLARGGIYAGLYRLQAAAYRY